MEAILFKPLIFFLKKTLFVCTLIFSFAYSTYAFSTEVLVLHSGFQSDLQTHEIQRGIENTFEGVEISLYVSYLDNSHKAMTSKDSLAYVDFLSRKFKGKSFDAVIVTGKNALKLVQDYSKQLFINSPIIFTGIKLEDPSIKGFTHKISGIVESENLFDTVKLSVKLFPDVVDVYIVTDNLLHNESINEKIQMLYEQLNQRVNLINNTNSESLKALISKVQNNAVLVFNNSHINKNGLKHNHISMLKSLISVTRISVHNEQLSS